MQIPFSPPDMTEKEWENIGEVLRSGWITTGPVTKQLEKEVTKRCQSARSICLNSQTACAEMALRLLGVGPGDEVITSAYTYTASASVIDHVGATIRLVDTKPDSVEMDWEQVETMINERTKVIIPVDIAGIITNYDALYAVIEKKKDLFRPANALQEAFGRIIVLADTAHSFGAVKEGIPAGSWADFSAFSFHAVKNFTTAEGGALTWRKHPALDDEAIYQKLQHLSLHGQTKDALSKSRSGQWEYDIVGLWHKCNMTDVHAAIGMAQNERYDSLLARRREIIDRYDAAFRPLGVQTLEHYGADHASSGHLYITRIPGMTSEERNRVMEAMGDAGVACNVHYKPLPLMSAYKALGFSGEDYPNAVRFFENEITLPLHTRLTDEEVDYVIAQFSEQVQKVLSKK